MVTKEDIDKIVKTYPDEIHCLPKSTFEEQLGKHLCNYFKIKWKPTVFVPKKEESNKGKRKKQS